MATPDTEVEKVAEILRAADPEGFRFARTLRRTFDQIYDGRNTGRYRWEQLRKTEKTHFGSLVEINLHREFSFSDGIHLDYRIADIDVDCKWSQTEGGWMLPPEAIGQICLLVTGSDEKSQWSAGLVRADETSVTLGGDHYLTLNETGKKRVKWLWRSAALPENILLHLDPVSLKAIMVDLSGSNRGKERLKEIFRRIPNRPVGLAALATVAQQTTFLRHLHADGGVLEDLRSEGIVVFGNYPRHREMASRLALPDMIEGEFMSARLRVVDGPGSRAVQIGRRWYRRCDELETPAKPAPRFLR